jgi:HEPN domain-containing protein
MSSRAGDWYQQAQRDLDQAESSRREGRHEWACFAAQQAAEKAVTAVHLAYSQDAWGHVVARLLVELPCEAPADLVEKARVLDAFSIPTRYANSHADGPPFEHYGPLQSEEALRYAGEILGFAGPLVAGR